MAQAVSSRGKRFLARVAAAFPRPSTDKSPPFFRIPCRRGLRIVLCILAIVLLCRAFRFERRMNAIALSTRIPLVQYEPENRAAYYMAAANALNLDMPLDPFTDGCETIDRALVDLARNRKPWDPQISALSKFVESNRKSLQIFQGALNAPTCRAPMLHLTSYGNPLPHTPQAEQRMIQDLSRLRILARLLLAESSRKLAAGETAEAVRLARACLFMGRDLAPAGGLEQSSVGVYCGALGCRALAQAVTYSPLDESTLALVNEATATEWHFRSWTDDPARCCRSSDWWALLLAVRDPTREAILNVTGLVYIAHTPSYSSLAYLAESGEASRNLIEADRPDEIRPAYEEDDYINADLRLVRACVEIQHFVKQQGRLPVSLPELAEVTAAEMPVHPVSGEPLHLECHDWYVTLWYDSASSPAFTGRKLSLRLSRVKPAGPIQSAARTTP